MVRVIVFFSLVLLSIGSPIAEIYKWVDKEGKVHYGDCPPADCKPEEVKIAPGPSEEDIQKSRQRTQKLLKEQTQRQRLREHEAKEKEQAELRKADAKKFADLELEFGGHWVIGIDLEQQCHEKYKLSCDALLNWKNQAIKKCQEEHGSDQDCEDDSYLLRFKPLTIEEQRKRGVQLRSRQRRLYNQ